MCTMVPRRENPAADAASEIFVDRETPKKVFDNAVRAIPSDGCALRVWYGVGGQGKTALARELYRMSGTNDEPQYTHLRPAMLDLHGRDRSDPDLLMVRIRNGFARAGLSFPAFDVAFAIMWEATRREDKLPTFIKPWLHRIEAGTDDMADDLVTLSLEALQDFIDVIPLARTLSRRGARWAIDKSKRAWLAQNHQYIGRLSNNGQIKEPYELSQLMPWMLAQDLNQHLQNHPEERLVLFIDEYERVFDAGGMGARWQENDFDAHLRKFVAETNGLLALFFSRERLIWEDSPDWRDNLKNNQHLLGGLSDDDANDWLQKVPIADQAIRAAIIEGAREIKSSTAAIYPLLLDLQVEHWRNLGAEATAADFRVDDETFAQRQETLVRRLLRDYPDDIQQILTIAALPLRFDQAAFLYMVNANNISNPSSKFYRLKTLSMIDVDEDGWLSLHRSIADAIVQMTPEAERSHHREQLRQHFEDRAKPDRPADVSHETLAALDQAIHLRMQAGPYGFFAWFSQAIERVDAAGKMNFLQPAWQQVRAFLSQHFGESDPDTLATRHNLAQQIGNQGRYREAEAEFRAIWEIGRQPDVLGETHPDTLTTRANLALQIGRQGRYQEAEDELRAIWEIGRQPGVLGESHPDTLTTRANLAFQIGRQGRYQEAEDELRAIWEIGRQPGVLGETHPFTLATRHNLAQQIGKQGRYQEAEAEFRAIWKVQRQPDLLGETHPSTLTTRHNLAQQIGNQGRYQEAEAEFRAIWEIERQPDVLGESHPSTLTTRANLAQQIGNQGRCQEAEAEFRAIWQFRRQPGVLGETHPSTLTTWHNLAQQIGNQGRYQEAEAEFRAIWQFRRRPGVLGESHPDTLTTRHNLALQIGKQGRYQEAEDEFRAIWKVQRQSDVLGESHPSTLRTRFWLVKMLDKLGKAQQATVLLEGLLDGLLLRLPQEHEWVVELKDYLAGRNSGQG
jgi:tetratricopeptide (TPR) repeat protein